MDQAGREIIVRQKLCELLSQDRTLVENLTRCRGLLNDLCLGCRREVNILTHALAVGMVAELCGNSVPKMSPIALGMLLTRLVSRLRDEHGISVDAAWWAVQSWAMALGLHIPTALIPIAEQTSASRHTTRLVPPAPKPSEVRKSETQRVQRGVTAWVTTPEEKAGVVPAKSSDSAIQSGVLREALPPLNLTGIWEGQLSYLDSDDHLANPWQLRVSLTQQDDELKGTANNFGVLVGKVNVPEVVFDTQISEGAWSSKHVVFIGKVLTSEDPGELFIEGTFEGNKFDRGSRMKLSGKFVLARVNR